MTHHHRRLILAVFVALGLLTLIPGITLPMMTGFSVIFPLGKYAVMAAYLYYYPPIPAALAHWQHWLGKIGKFSMLDVFVVAQMLMILKLGWLVEVQIHSGIYWYSATALLSLIAGIWIEHDIKQRMRKAG